MKSVFFLSRHFVEVSCHENQLPLKTLSEEAFVKLHSYSWPGNARELQNVMERSVLLSSGSQIGAEEIQITGGPLTDEKALAPGMTVEEAERLLIMKTLEFTSQNRTRAAEMLGISIRTLRNKLNEYKGIANEADL